MERQLCVMVHAIPHYLLIFLLMYVLNLLLLCWKNREIIWLKCKNLNWDSAISVHIRGITLLNLTKKINCCLLGVGNLNS